MHWPTSLACYCLNLWTKMIARDCGIGRQRKVMKGKLREKNVDESF